MDKSNVVGSSNWTPNNVCTNGQMYLFLFLTRDTSNKWWCAQATSQQLLSFGSFVFYVESRIDLLNPNVVFSLAVTNGVGRQNGIFIDMSPRGNSSATANNLWYTVYPNSQNQSVEETAFQIPTLQGSYTTHRIQ
jgi:hypothetical protein